MTGRNLGLLSLAGLLLLGCGGEGGQPGSLPDARPDVRSGRQDLGDGGPRPDVEDEVDGGAPVGRDPDAGARPSDPGDPAAGNPDGAAADRGNQPESARPTVPTVPPEIDGRVVINEIMASNGLTLKNEAGLAGDWIELFNPTSQDLPLAGYAVTDDLNAPAKAVISPGVVLPARGHLLLWLDGAVDRGPKHLPLRLIAEGGSLALARPDGSFINRLVYGAQETDFSAAREPDGSDAWVIEWHPSPGTANPAGRGTPLAPGGPGTPPEAVPAAGDLSETFLGHEAMPQLRINVDSEAASKLRSAPRVYVPATLVFQGRSYGPVGLRLKGSASFEPFDDKPSLRINVDEYVPDAKFFGLKDLTLNNMHDDSSMMHERLAYWVHRTAGVPASRASHVLLSINGQAPALYTNVETVKKKMLGRWFKNAEGPLYAATDVDFTTADTMFPHEDGTPRDLIPLYELKSKVDDRSLLYNLARALAMRSPDEAMAAAAAYVHLPQFLSFWAVNAIVAQFDAMPYSIRGDDYFVYASPDDGKLHILPWGMDETFEANDIDVVKTVYSVLARTCAASAACLQQFVDRAWSIMDKLEASNWTAESERIAQQIATATRMDRRKRYTDAQVADQQENMRYFLQERRVTLGQYIRPPATP